LKAQSDLQNPDANPIARVRAVQAIYDAVKKESPEDANTWLINAREALKQKLPIGLDDSWMTGPHESVFPEMKEPNAQETFEGEGGGQQQGTPAPRGQQPLLPAPAEGTTPGGPMIQGEVGEGPFDLTTAHARQNAADANEALWAARDAEEARRQRFMSNGTLSTAAVAGIDSGIVAEKGAERAAEAPQGGQAEPAGNEQEQLNIRSWTRNTSGMSLAAAQQKAVAAEFQSGRGYAVVPHPAGGYAVLPSDFISPQLRQQYDGLQRVGQVPARAARQMPLQADAAAVRAQTLTNQTGVEHEVVPHPMARDKFVVQPKQETEGAGNASATREQQPGGVEQHQGTDAGLQQAGLDRNQQAGVQEKGAEAGGGNRAEQSGQEQQGVIPTHRVGEDIQNPSNTERTPTTTRLTGEIPEQFVTRAAKAGHPIRDLTEDERDTVTGVLNEATRLGVPDSHLDDISGFHAFDDPSYGNATYNPRSGRIGIASKWLGYAKQGSAYARELAFKVLHELTHHIDNDGDDHAASIDKRADAMMGISVDENGMRQPEGIIMKEAIAAFFGGDPRLQKLLRYPLAAWDRAENHPAGHGYGGVTNLLKEELFAQLGALYHGNKALMRAGMPEAYKLFKEINDAGKRGKTIADARRAVRDALWSRDAAERDGRNEVQRRADQANARIFGDRFTDRGLEEQPGAAGRRDEGAAGVGGESGGGGRREGAGPAQQGRPRPLRGYPAKWPGPNEAAREAALAYMKEHKLPYAPPKTFVRVDPELGEEIAQAYARMKNDPSNPAVKAAYEAMIAETIAQYKAMMKAGLKVEMGTKERPYPYKLPHEMIDDVRNNNHMWVYPTSEGFGVDKKFDATKNPLRRATDIKDANGVPMLANDVFRAVHDYFGHAKEGNLFRANGEENAWRSHAAMYSPLARRAMTSETRGQNSWVNWGPHGEKNRTANQEETHYADQKTGLLPDKYTTDNYEPRDRSKELPADLAQHMTTDEQFHVHQGTGRVKRLLDIFNRLPESKLYVAAAKAGAAAKEWYRRSLEGIQQVYGEDTQRFLQLMAALSPQTNVKGNFYNAARVFKAWEKSGRTTDTVKLAKIFRDNLVTDQGREEGKKAMAAWTINGTRVLLAKDPNTTRLSGPKVSSFMANLLGHYDEVTNDRHMADFAGIDVEKTKLSVQEGKFATKSPAYIAMSAKVREAARELGWTPAETQAAIWSWWNSLKRLVKETGKSAIQLMRDGDLTRDRIAREPHLGSYLNEDEFRSIDQDRGRRAAELAAREGNESVEAGSSAAEEGSRSAPSRADLANARRIDQNLAAVEDKRRLAREADETEAEREARLEREGMQDRFDRNPDEPTPPFYSGMDRAIAEKAPFAKDGSIGAGQLKMWLAARAKEGLVKNDEMQWTGINEWLDLQKGKVTRDQVADFLKEHGVRVEENLIGGSLQADVLSSMDDFREVLEKDGYTENQVVAMAGQAQRGELSYEQLRSLSGRARILADRVRYAYLERERNRGTEEAQTQYHSYQLPGGKNYRELLLRLPARIEPGWEKTEFRSSHFDQPNVLAHIRFNDRTDANGKKVLFIEELQSDWAQKGRREGFASNKPEYVVFNRFGEVSRFSNRADAEEALSGRHGKDREGWGIREEQSTGKFSIPNAPFVGKTEAWVALALKRMIRYAAENGYDRVAWTNGEQQAERYDLSKHVKNIDVHKTTSDNSGRYIYVDGKREINPKWGATLVVGAVSHDGERVINERIPADKLGDLIGKDAAKKVTDQFAEGVNNASLRGLDLKVGGEGMKSFYDQIVPNVANDVLKKLGGGRVDSSGIKVGESRSVQGEDVEDVKQRVLAGEMDVATPQHGFDITPQMRAKVLEGQPLFEKEGEPGVFSRARISELLAKATGGKAAESEQQFSKSGEPLYEHDAGPQPVDPKNLQSWMKNLSPEMLDSIRKAGGWVATKSWRERWADNKHEMGTRILQATLDQFISIQKKLGDMPYKLARMASSYDAGIEALLRYGQIYLNKAGAISVKQDTKGVFEILKPLGNEVDRFTMWVAAQRAERLSAEDREHNFGGADIENLKKLNTVLGEGDEWKGEGSRAMAYAKALKEWNEINSAMLDLGVESGTLSKEVADRLRDQPYIPFFRAAEDGEQAVRVGNTSGMVNQYFSKRLKGGEGELHDLLANTLQNWSHIVQSTLKNNAASKILEAAEKKGYALEASAGDKGAVFVMRNGEAHYYTVQDHLLLDSISALEASPFKVPQSLAWFKSALTRGTTLSPIFRLRHTIREQIASLILGHGSYNPVKNWIDGFKYSSRNNPEYGNMLAGGSFFRMGYSYEDNRAAYFKASLAHGIDTDSILDTPGKIKKVLGESWDWWQEVGERSDSITRANMYRTTYAEKIAEGMNPDQAHFEASYAARSVLDYGLHGTLPAIKMITGVVPFMNARMQGLYVIGKAAAADPARFAAVVGGVTLATMALSLAYRNDKEMQAREEWDRDNFWAFRVGDKMVRIPKPFELGAVASIADRALEVALNGFQPADRQRFLERIVPIIGSQLNLNPIASPVIATPIQLWGNKDWFTGRSIETAHDENLRPTDRFNLNTHQTSIVASRALNTVLPDKATLSPEQIDFAVNSFFGWVGVHALMTADLAVRPLSGAPNRPAMRIDDTPIVGDFVKTLPENSTRDVEAFYTHLTQVQQAFGSMRALQKTGQMEQAAQAYAENKNNINLHGLYIKTQREIGKLNQMARYIEMKNMDPDEKRQDLDRIAQQRNNLAAIAERTRAATLNR
jgi:hypothetical protein